MTTIILINKKSSMVWKETVKKKMGDPKTIIGYRFSAAKIVFVLSAILFFLHFFLIGAQVPIWVISDYLGFSYSIFITSLSLFLYYGIRRICLNRLPEWSKYIILFIVWGFLVFAAIPLVFSGGITFNLL